MELVLSSAHQQNEFVCALNNIKRWSDKRRGLRGYGVIMDTPMSSGQHCLEKGDSKDVSQLQRQFPKTSAVSTSAHVENELVSDGVSSSTRKSSKTTPKLSTETPGFKPPPGRLKLNERRSRCFQRAFSCDVVERPEETVVEKPPRSCHNQEMEMTYVENDNEENEADETNKMSHSDITTNNLADGKKGSDTVDSGTLSSSDKDSGIVCSDEDLRFILTEVSQSRRLTVEAKREKMKSNRSLSLDSSFFKLHMKRLQADSPAWLSRILSQRERSSTSISGGNGGSISGNGASAATVTDESSSSPPQLISPSSGISNNLSLKRNIYKKPEASPATITEDTTSFEEDSSSRRESNVSCGSDDERSLLLINNSESPVASVKSSATGNEIPKAKTPIDDNSSAVASKVVWNEGSVVDAEVLGTAIEFYLTSVSTQKPAGTTTTADTCRPDIEKEHHGHTTNGVSAPVVSTLKGLFVK